MTLSPGAKVQPNRSTLRSPAGLSAACSSTLSAGVAPVCGTPPGCYREYPRTEAGLTDGRHMTKQTPVTGFSAGEREYIRRELDMFFSTLPTVAEGF